MVENDIFRLAMILSSGQSATFQNNLKKLVQLVLFDTFGSPQTSLQIKTAIQSQYSLEFSEAEILSAIRGDTGFILTEHATDPFYNTYALHPDKYEKFKVQQTVNIDDYISQFIESDEFDRSLEFSALKDLIYKFLYFSFNSDTKTVLELMNKDKTGPKAYCVSAEFNPAKLELLTHS